MPRKKIVVVYHSPCPDGFGAAWAAWKKFGNKAEYRPTSHGDTPPAFLPGEVYFLDLVYKPQDMERILKHAAKVVVVDHHVTALPSLTGVKEKIYDIDHSGAVLAWKYFHGKKSVPKLLLHVEDEDIWKFKLKDTPAVNARVELLDFDFKQWDAAIRGFERAPFRKKFIAEGALIEHYRMRIVERMIQENATRVNFLGHHVLAVNASKPFTSEIGHRLAKMRPPIGIVWHERHGRLTVSLRSDGSVDVAKIAQKFGGGGHKGASGFNLRAGAARPWKEEK